MSAKTLLLLMAYVCWLSSSSSSSSSTTTTTSSSSLGAPLSPGAALDAHNGFRSRHRASPLVWDEDLARAAGVYAAACDFTHDPENNDQGENLYVSSLFDAEGELAKGTKMWYDEVKLYDFDKPGFSEDTGHFTQMVWRGTSRLGCAAHLCPENINDFRAKRGTIVVCRYFPPGNVLNAFRRNVKISSPTSSP